jgi:diaminopimelate decarboxylase
MALPGAPEVAYRGDSLHLEDLALGELARRFGTPLYAYSMAAMARALSAYQRALAGRDHLICYAVKANSNLAVLQWFARQGCGFDIVSGGELERVLAAGGDPARIVFSGVGKTRAEMAQALAAGVLCFNVESVGELESLSAVAAGKGCTAQVSLRVNPDVDAKTHPYISTGLRGNKFGIAHTEALAAYRRAAQLPGIEVVGIDCRIGSQITERALVEALDRLLDLVETLEAKASPFPPRSRRRPRHRLRRRDAARRRRPDPPPARRIDARGHGRSQAPVRAPGRSLVGN